MKRFTKILSVYVVLVIVCLVACALTGCAGSVNRNTPHTSITGELAGQPFDIENPKDTILDGLTVEVTTNHTARIHIEHLSTVMNPTNIAATGDAGAKLVEANGNAIVNGINAAAAAAGNLAGAAGKTMVK